MQIDDSNYPPSKTLYDQIKGSFVSNGQTFTAWCKQEQLNISNTRSAILGSWNGPKGQKVRKLAIKASGLAKTAA